MASQRNRRRFETLRRREGVTGLARLSNNDPMAIPRRVREEEELKPYQVELLKLQRYLEAENRRMIVLFEGRDAAGKGG
ncbi:MAG: hypothetical protein KDB56_06260, partial [Mycobacterium sp.]|nr:hypothetical protein [Mycobacterium sp.]